MRGLLGIAGLLLIALALGEDRRRIPWRVVVGGLALQAGLALLFLKLPGAGAVLRGLNAAVGSLQTATDAGTALVFGFLGGAPLPYAETVPGGSYVLAFRAFPLVLVISALTSLALHWGVLQRVVGGLAWGLARTLGVGGALGLGAAVHVFVGQIEAPLLVRPYLAAMSRGELHALMSCGLAGIAGTVMVIYGTILAPVLPDAFGQILIAAVLSTPAALALAAMVIPFAADARAGVALGQARLDEAALGEGAGGDAAAAFGEAAGGTRASSALEAVMRGTLDGISLVAAIIATLIVLVALVTLVNAGVGLIPLAGAPLSLQRIFAWGFRPLVWLIGVPWDQSAAAAGLMGTKTVLNEFVAYLELSRLPQGALDPHARLIMVYALCGFANFGSLGILLGGLGTLVPSRRPEIAELGWRSLVTGTLATLMSGAMVGLIA